MSYMSNALVTGAQKVTANTGKLCFHNIVSPSAIAATSEASFRYPASNMANPATAFGWEAADTTDQTITIQNPTRTAIDYLGIARHNLGQLGLTISIRFDGALVMPETPIGEQQSLLFLFSEATPSEVSITISGATTPAKIAVIYCGMSLSLQRNIYIGHTPISYGRDRSQINGVSQAGEYLGEVLVNETLSTSVNLQNLTPDWYRKYLDPFFSRKPRHPCFWAWRPGKYPLEIAYCWIEGNPRPTNQRSNGMMDISWNFRGIA
jgi:hypothetical protein